MWPDDIMSECAAMCAADDGWLCVLRWCRHPVAVPNDDPRRGPIPPRQQAVRSTGHRRPPLLVMPSSHVHQRADGIRVTSPARTVFDLSRHSVQCHREHHRAGFEPPSVRHADALRRRPIALSAREGRLDHLRSGPELATFLATSRSTRTRARAVERVAGARGDVDDASD